MIRYEVSREDVKYVQKKIKNIETEAPKVFKNAVNHTAKKARKKLAEGAQGSYTVKDGGFHSRMRIQNATNKRLYAVIRSKGRPLTITRFHTTAPKSSGKADIVKSGLKQLVGPKRIKAFKRGKLMMQRESRDRYPLKVLHSVSVPKMLEKVYGGERGIEGAIGPVIQQTLHDEIRKEVQKLIGGR